jgi:hypothetical protein
LVVVIAGGDCWCVGTYGLSSLPLSRFFPALTAVVLGMYSLIDVGIEKGKWTL